MISWYIKQIQKSFLHCFYDSDETENQFRKLIENENYDFSRYNFFLVDYLLSKQEIKKAQKVINISRKEYSSNLLIKEMNNLKQELIYGPEDTQIYRVRK